jgi:hypothetical protein
MKSLVRDLGLMLLAVVITLVAVKVVVLLLAHTVGARRPIDATDRSWRERSGLQLHIDHGTGCHWLSGLFGPPVPRLDRNGKQICTGESR